MNFTTPIFFMSIVFYLASGTVVAQNSNSGLPADRVAAIEKEILRMEEAGKQKILKGDKNWDDLIADGAYMIGFDGSVITYQRGYQFPPLPVKAFNMSEMIVRVYGEVAVVTGLAEVQGQTPDKKPFAFKMRFLNIWKKSPDTWKIVVSERTGVRPVPPG